MGEIVKMDGVQKKENKLLCDVNQLSELTKGVLLDSRKDILNKSMFSIPITQLATLGAGVSSLIPAFQTVTQTVNLSTDGLFRIVNASAGDTLKIAKNGNVWAALKTADGSSKLVQLQSASPLSTTTTTVAPFNPATILMAAALFSIEQKLDGIEKTQKQILTFLEAEKESEIEADMEMLASVLSKYKHNWDNEQYLQSNHKMVLDIQRTARKNMLSYQKQVADVLGSKRRLVGQKKVSSVLDTLFKQFQYYRLALYLFSLASLLEILLSGNFEEEYITGIKQEIETLSFTYRDLYGKSSVYLENLEQSVVETNVIKGIGTASKAVGKFIGSIPKIRDGKIDEILQDTGVRMKSDVEDLERSVQRDFAKISNPGIAVFTEKMQELSRIYNYTTEICFDEKQIYLVAG
jgi:hypothetical protein